MTFSVSKPGFTAPVARPRPAAPAGLGGRPRARAPRSAWRALRHPAFRLYFAGSVISSLGTWLHNTAQVLLAYQLTHSVFAVGLVTCAQFSGSLLLGPWAAVVASRIGGRRMLIGTQLLSGGVAAELALLQAAGLLRENFLIVGALALGLIFTFALPVQTALVPKLVPDSDTEAAMAMNSVSYNAGRALAPALCVLLVAASGFAWAFALNAVSFLIFAAALTKVTPRSSARPPQPARARDGFRTALAHPRILLLLGMVAAVTFADDPVLILGPALARQLTGAGPDWAGYFLSALGAGTVLGSLRPAADPQARDASGSSRRAAWSLVVLVACIGLFAAGISRWVSLGAAFLAGAAALRTGAVTQTQLVRQEPARTASVMALWAIAWAGTKPLASLADGWLASHQGVIWAAVILGVPAAGLGLAEIFLPGPRKAWLKERARRFAGASPATAVRGAAPAATADSASPATAMGSARPPALCPPVTTGQEAIRVIIVSPGKHFMSRDHSAVSGSARAIAGCGSGGQLLSTTGRLGCASPGRTTGPDLPSAHSDLLLRWPAQGHREALR